MEVLLAETGLTKLNKAALEEIEGEGKRGRGVFNYFIIDMYSVLYSVIKYVMLVIPSVKSTLDLID